MSEPLKRYVLTLSCPERKGIVRGVSSFLYDIDATIVSAGQYSDSVFSQFFMRTEFASASGGELLPITQLRKKFASIANSFSMDWTLHDGSRRVRVIVAVSKLSHCLNDLLHRWKVGVMPIDILAVVSNHDDLRTMVEWHGVPYHHLPITADTKREQENRILTIMRNGNAELLLLARYMQVLSNEMCGALAGKAINIHHSFLPGFKGARPYHQAYERGVKIIGATAHYVTGDLDEGPIIEQCVERVDHQCSPDELVQIGRDTECMAFARAIKWHSEHRVILNGNRTVVFK